MNFLAYFRRGFNDPDIQDPDSTPTPTSDDFHLILGGRSEWGKLFDLQLELFLLTVKLLCLQSLKALIRRTFPL